MPDIIANGQPFESSPEAASDIYANTPPSFLRGFKAEIQSSTTGYLYRATERGSQYDASIFDRALYHLSRGYAEPGVESLQAPEEERTPQIPATDANARYAPPGVKITDKPISEGLARIIGRQKYEELERNNTIARFQAAHSAPRNFLVGMAAFTLDPLNLATMFVPGFGEEVVTARLGGGFLARTAGRAVQGGTGATLGMAPSIALRYGLSQEERSDYTARDALTELFYAAAGGAILSAGFGAAGEAIRGTTGRVLPAPSAPTTPSEAPTPSFPIERLDINWPPDATAAAMRGVISQFLDGRIADVLPIVDAEALRLSGREAELQSNLNAATFRTAAFPPVPEAEAAASRLSRLEVVEQELKGENLSVEQRRKLLRRRDELLTNTTPEALRAQTEMLGQRRALEAERREIEAELARVRARKAQMGALKAGLGEEQPGIRLSGLAQAQQQIYRNGFEQSIPQHEFDAANETVYGERTKVEGATPEEEAAIPKPPETSAEAKIERTEPDRDLTPEEKAADALEAQWTQFIREAQPALTKEQIEELQAARLGYDRAKLEADGYNQAVVCLDGSGV